MSTWNVGVADLEYAWKIKGVEQFHSKYFQHNSIITVSGTVQTSTDCIIISEPTFARVK